MKQRKSKNEALLQDLISTARDLHIEVRTEKLLRDVGYRPHSGRCRFKGQDLIIIDREISLQEQVDLLAMELDKKEAVKS